MTVKTLYSALSVYNIHWLLFQGIYDDTSWLVLTLFWGWLSWEQGKPIIMIRFIVGCVFVCVCVTGSSSIKGWEWIMYLETGLIDW